MLVTMSQLAAAIRGPSHPVRILKAEEKRFVLGVAYPAAALDGHGDFMRPDELERTAWDYLTKRQIGLHHQAGTVGHARPVESYIWRADPWTLQDVTGAEQTVMPGDWVLGAVWDPQAWQVVKSGRVQGWSIDGIGKRRAMSRAEAGQIQGGLR